MRKLSWGSDFFGTRWWSRECSCRWRLFVRSLDPNLLDCAKRGTMVNLKVILGIVGNAATADTSLFNP